MQAVENNSAGLEAEILDSLIYHSAQVLVFLIYYWGLSSSIPSATPNPKSMQHTKSEVHPLLFIFPS